MSINNTIVDDNFISLAKQKEIYELLVSSGDIDWHLNLKTNNYLEKNKDTFQFTHAFYMNDEACSPHYNIIINLFNDFLIKHNLNCNKIIRAKANLTTKNKDMQHLEPHIDTNIPHRVFLYYVNDSDGSTVFYKNKVNLEKPLISLDEAEFDTEVSPLMGRAINFNGLTYHSASSPKENDLRAVINIAYIDY